MTAKFRLVALVEAASFLALLVATIFHRVLDGSDTGITVLGPIHGVLFLAYVLLTLLVREEQGWNLGQTLVVIVASAIPFGAFVVNAKMVSDPAPSSIS